MLPSEIMVLVRIPNVAKTKTKPRDNASETFNPLRMLRNLLLPDSVSIPRKQERYAGNIANPQGLKAAIKPAASGKARSTLIMGNIFQVS